MASILALASGAPAGAEISGTWIGHYVFENPDGEVRKVPACLILRQTETGIEGSGGPDEERQRPFDRVAFTDPKLTLEQDHQSGRILVLELVVDGDAMSGTMKHRGEDRDPTRVRLYRREK